ncbi:NADH-quinone oxidoreductase subunit L, partial [Pseudofulvimonas gallinarii]
YYVDAFYQAVFARGSLLLGRGLWKGADVAVIDDGLVNGSAKLVGRVAALVRRAQTGFLYHYAFAMIVGLLVLLGGFVWYANR